MTEYKKICNVQEVEKKHPAKHIRKMVFDTDINAFRDASKKEILQRGFCYESNIYEGLTTVIVILMKDAPISAKAFKER